MDFSFVNEISVESYTVYLYRDMAFNYSLYINKCKLDEANCLLHIINPF